MERPSTAPVNAQREGFFEAVNHTPSRKKAAFHAYLQQQGILGSLKTGLNAVYTSPHQPDPVTDKRGTAAAMGVPVVQKTGGIRPLPSGSSGTCTRKAFGRLNPGNKTVYLYTLTNPSGAYVRVMPWGATVVGIHVPDRTGTLRDVVLGYDAFDGFAQGRNPSFGSVPGRVVNRIAKGRFTLDGTDYKLETNDGDNHLHGGAQGFHKQLWEAEEGTGASVAFTITSPDGTAGYPGECTARVVYTWTDDNMLLMDYEAVVQGKPTIVNLTNHCYFNLKGPGDDDIKSHQMVLRCSQYTPVGDGSIPTGELAAVEGTPFDFRAGKTLGQDLAAVPGGPGYDHNLVLDKPAGAAAHSMTPFALVVEPSTGLSLEVASTHPGVQLFTANGQCVKGIKGKMSYEYPAHGGFCLEAQNFPDAINHPGVFPSPILRPGDKYTSRTAYKFGVQPQFKPLVEGKDDPTPPNLKWMELPACFRPAAAEPTSEEAP